MAEERPAKKGDTERREKAIQQVEEMREKVAKGRETLKGLREKVRKELPHPDTPPKK